MIKEYDVVTLGRDIQEENLKAGMKGKVVMIYNEPNLPTGYEIEFMDKEGNTIALITLTEKDIIT